MFSIVLPLQAILFQSLFLAIAIAIEAYIFQRQWKLGRRKSVEYSLALNLFSTVVGWVIFFAAQPLLSPALKKQIITYIFFNNLASTASSGSFLYGEIALLVFLSFVFILISELIFLEVLRSLTREESPVQSEPRYRYTTTSSLYRRYYESKKERINSTTILVANAVSGSAILLIAFLKELFVFQ
jgi:hypothetical protein